MPAPVALASKASLHVSELDSIPAEAVQAKTEKLSEYLYIKNLADDVDDDHLRSEFEPFGTVTSCKVMRDEKGTSNGFGFVCYSSLEQATKAAAEMNNKPISAKPIQVTLAQRREVRRQQLESQIGLPTGSGSAEEGMQSKLTALKRVIELLQDLQHDNIVQYLCESLS